MANPESQSSEPTQAAVQTTNPTAATAVQDVTQLIDQGEAAAETALEAEAPILASPVFKTLFQGIMNWITNVILGPMITTFTGKIVVGIEEYQALQNAVSAQAALNAAKAGGNQNAINQASQNVDSAIAGAIQYIGQS